MSNYLLQIKAWNYFFLLFSSLYVKMNNIFPRMKSKQKWVNPFQTIQNKSKHVTWQLKKNSLTKKTCIWKNSNHFFKSGHFTNGDPFYKQICFTAICISAFVNILRLAVVLKQKLNCKAVFKFPFKYILMASLVISTKAKI